jgi:Zn-dependent M28 family amino/carboxypeptidase
MPRKLAAALFLAALVPAAAGTYPGHPATMPDITAADISTRDKALADDAFEGRGPGTVAGEAAAQWIADELKRLGIAPANHGSYFQPVPAVTIRLDPAASHLSFATSKGALTPRYPDETVWWTPQFAGPEVAVKDSPLVFVGYGVVAPEYGWNDYQGVDVKGKTVVILINDPGNEDASPDPNFFKGKAMTYYGRWTYKFEEAARHGAAAAIIVHETGPAAYGWQVLRTSDTGSKLWLDAKDHNRSMSPIQGWITFDTAKDLFARAGLDYLALKAAANKRGFHAVPMTGETLSANAHSSVTHLNTRNVAGIIPGTKHPSDIVMFSAHWDHLGHNDAAAGSDKIFNGAVDNGMGVSMMLELAEKFAHEHHPQRSVAFAFWTLEEQGLLGSQYFAEHPLWPRNHIVGVLNRDGDTPRGIAHDMVLPGSGQTELENLLSDALATQNRVPAPDPTPQLGYFYRSDNFSLAREGIPAFSPKGGRDLVNGGTARGQALSDDFIAHHYHQPSDEWTPDMDFTGAAQDTRVFHVFGDTLANSDAWPNFYSGSEFRAARDRVMAK